MRASQQKGALVREFPPRTFDSNGPHAKCNKERPDIFWLIPLLAGLVRKTKLNRKGLAQTMLNQEFLVFSDKGELPVK